MESCPVPIEICELIIDFVGEGPPQDPERRHNLQQCALTCRAWRTRAQRCLWQVWHIRSSASINLFVDTIRRAPDSLVSYIHTLVLDFYDIRNIGPSGAISYPLPRLNELLLTTKLANLGELTLQGAVGPGSPLQLLHPNILRIRPPMLANVTVLELWRCTFSSPRSMLDLIWACPNLVSLDIDDEWTFLDGTLVTEEAARRLVSTCQRSGACSKLEDLDFSFNLSSDSSPSPLCYALFNVTHGSIFGSQITSMVLDVTMKQLHVLTNFLPGVFPALTTLEMHIYPPGGDAPYSLLRMLAERIVAPTRLRSVTVSCRLPHGAAPANCEYCRAIVGGVGADTDGWGHLLRGRFRSLEELCFEVEDEHGLRCAAYIDSVLPNLRGVLCFSYHDMPYVVPRLENAPPSEPGFS